MTQFLTSRSAILEYQRCPRARYYRYHYQGTGITPVRRSIPLVVGSAAHKGFEALLQGDDLESAVSQSLQLYSEETESRGFDLNTLEDASYVYNEQRALTEALVRVFYHRGLQELLTRYKVLDIEREINWQIAPNITLMVRADGELEDKELDEPFILSFKTAAYYDRRKQSDGGHDVQGLSEMAAFEQSVGRKPMGVQMVYLIKGTRTETYDNSGIYAQASSLIRPWMKTDAIRPTFAWKWKWEDERGGHTLGKGYKRVPIWEIMPVKEWIDILASRSIQPEAGDALAASIIFPPPIFRREDEQRDWVEQVIVQERRIKHAIDNDPYVRPENRRKFLNQTFPQFRRSCDYPSACDFQKICFGPAKDEPIETGLYQIRKPHHELELAQHIERSTNEYGVNV